MKIMIRLLFIVLLLPAVNALAEDAAAAPPPDALVRQVVGEVISSIEQNREITHDLRKMDDLVDVRILPHFDFPRMTQLTIGSKYWADAMPQDQQQLISEFRTFLAHAFSDVIAEYTNQKIFFTPLHMQPEGEEIIVKTTVIDSDGPTRLDYKMEKTASGWMIYDVSMEGISLTRIYRSNFSNELLHGGVPSLVSVLHKKNLEVEAARQTPVRAANSVYP
jgi:phospholipid transport system substrate-binding protein